MEAPELSGLVIILSPQALTDSTGVAEAVVAAVKGQVESALRFERAQKLASKAANDLSLALFEAKARTPEAVAAFARDNQVPYRLLWAGPKRVPGWDVPGVPTAFLIRPDGTLVRAFYGPKHKTTLGWEIEKVLPKS